MKHPLATAAVAATAAALAVPLVASRSADGAATEAIRASIAHYFLAGDTARSSELKRAFHPTAMMFFAGKEGRLSGVSQPEWWERTDGNKTPVAASRRAIPTTDAEGEVASAKVVSDYATHQFQDYMLLVKLGEEWKIVSKVFHRWPAGGRPANASDAPDRQAVEAVLKEKLAAMDGLDAVRLGSAYHPRAMTYTVLEGQLVSVSPAEWQARYASRREAAASAVKSAATDTSATKAVRRILSIDAAPTAATAKLEHDLGGERSVDYVNLVKADGAWRIVGLVYTRAESK